MLCVCVFVCLCVGSPVVDQMLKVDQQEKSQLFYMPWDYKTKPFMTETEYRAEIIEKEITTDVDAKLDSLKNEMNVKNQAIIELINSKFVEVSQLISSAPATQQQQARPTLQHPHSYAGVVASSVLGQVHGRQGGQGGGNGRDSGPLVPTFNLVTPAGLSDNTGQVSQERGRGHPGVIQQNRSRSISNKRKRMDEGGAEENSGRSDKSQNAGQKKYVVGTSNQTGRKMRSPPADIFVYGVHPDTTPEDIVQDLACNDIIINTTDIVLKSKDEAYLKSYKISVKAEDLSRALDPSVWPLRVKVREFIHYSRKNTAGYNQRGGWQDHRQGGGRVGQGVGAGAEHQASQQAGEQRGQPHLLAPNRYAVLDDNVPGGLPQAV